ncbi:gamma-glutamylcyclotransferase family protein [Thaumasiovibrio subtropicus]|uniref:gamma-glutamylcyclotransferase family protein n=1 Tax=Thaumasiovibrio subtropicus TaxID=1891207 RepID=UPI000B35213D|nr:gamma-glutamylcyclotransferase family protein [Thaumasiovibrio subtropicus]
MYLIGYGSLINRHSRQLTQQTGQCHPVFVTGFDRHWSKIDDSYTLSPLAVTPGTGGFNAVVIDIDKETIDDFDKRERGYIRIEVPQQKLNLLEGEIDPARAVWMYINEDVTPPCIHIPIAQSYIDTVLSGCLDVSETFARQFISTTKGWHHPIENDRLAPKYSRVAGVTDDHQRAIDLILTDVLRAA